MAEGPAIRARIVADIEAERGAQDDRWGAWSAGGDQMSHPEKYAVLGEEVGEVGEAVVQQIADRRFRRGQHAEDLRAELIQVAAVAVAWVEAIDRARERRDG